MCEHGFSTGEETSSFRYQALDESPGSLRVIEVIPASKDGCIHIRLQHTHLPAKYRCLSYMWGDPGEDYEIYVDSRPMRVRRNLYQFLQAAQGRFSEQSLWIDALCINQCDHVEKSHQVQRMGKIYEDAEEVLIWIGEAPELDYVFRFVHSCFKTPESETSSEQITTKMKHKRVFAPPKHIVDNLERIADKRITDERIIELNKGQNRKNDREIVNIEAGLARLCSNRYWNRTWIAQEILAARELRIVNGQQETEWRELILTMDWVSHYLLRDPTSALNASLLRKFRNERRSRYNGSIDAHHSIWDLLSWLGNSECSNERDHIYALLFLVEDGSTFGVNYDEDVISLFWRAGEHFRAWTSQESMTLLCSNLRISATEIHEAMLDSVPPQPTLRIQHLFWSQLAESAPTPILYTHRFENAPHQLSCKQCLIGFETKTVHDVLACAEGSPFLVRERSHALLSPDSDGSFSVIFIPADRTYFPNYLSLSAGTLARCINDEWTEVYTLPTPANLDENTQYRLRLPAEHILVSLMCVELQEVG